LIVEDDTDISSVVDFNLRREGFATATTDSGATAVRMMRENPSDLVVLDVMLPDISGLDVCRELRGQDGRRQAAILLLTARGEEADRIAGLACGADDYIVKPFSIRELVLRARAVLRRSQDSWGGPPRIESGPITIDESAHRVFIGGQEAQLTNTEYQLLRVFLRRPGCVFTRGQLLDQVWNMPGDIVTRTVDTHIKRLREKLGVVGASIETVRAVGYRYMESSPEAPRPSA
jgi:two-component system phosphate regulon response regulator PhoB